MISLIAMSYVQKLVSGSRNLYTIDGEGTWNIVWFLMAKTAPILQLNIDVAPSFKNGFYINYGVLTLRRQFLTSLT